MTSGAIDNLMGDCWSRESWRLHLFKSWSRQIVDLYDEVLCTRRVWWSVVHTTCMMKCCAHDVYVWWSVVHTTRMMKCCAHDVYVLWWSVVHATCMMKCCAHDVYDEVLCTRRVVYMATNRLHCQGIKISLKKSDKSSSELDMTNWGNTNRWIANTASKTSLIIHDPKWAERCIIVTAESRQRWVFPA